MLNRKESKSAERAGRRSHPRGQPTAAKARRYTAVLLFHIRLTATPIYPSQRPLPSSPRLVLPQAKAAYANSHETPAAGKPTQAVDLTETIKTLLHLAHEHRPRQQQGRHLRCDQRGQVKSKSLRSFRTRRLSAFSAPPPAPRRRAFSWRSHRACCSRPVSMIPISRNVALLTLPLHGRIFLPMASHVITFDGTVYSVKWPNSARAVEVTPMNGYLNVSLWRSPVSPMLGLLGDGRGNPRNDLKLADETVLAIPVSFDDLYSRFAGAWRINAEQSLFDYDSGESTQGFTRAQFPTAVCDASTLPVATRINARQICQSHGISDAPLLDACTLDVAMFGNSGAAEAYTDLPTPVVTIPILPDTFESPNDDRYQRRACTAPS